MNDFCFDGEESKGEVKRRRPRMFVESSRIPMADPGGVEVISRIRDAAAARSILAHIVSTC